MTISDYGSTFKASDKSKDNSRTVEDDIRKKSEKVRACLRHNALTVSTMLAVVLGVGVGFILRESGPWTKRQIMYINFPGELFLRMLKCLILPLIISSLVSAVGNLDTKLSGKIAARSILYYMTTTVLAIVLGIVLVVAIRPGTGGSSLPVAQGKSKYSTTADTLMDLLRNMFPPNIIEACIAQFSTVLIPPATKQEFSNITNGTSSNSTGHSRDFYSWDFKGEYGGGTNILGLVVFSVVLGVTLGRMKEKGRPLVDVFTSLSDAMMKITKMVIWLTPLGVLFLVASKIAEMDNVSEIAGQVGMYTLTVLIGLTIHGFVTLCLIYAIFTKSIPYKFIWQMSQALATAFGTSSSSATLPVSIALLEDKIGVDSRITRFVLPVGATINMDGTALYEAVAAIFIAQVRQISLDAGKVIGISITATAASVGAAGIPQAGLVTMVMVLNVIGLPAEDVALILVVDWLLDRFRTTVNVLGDAFGAAIIGHISRDELETLDAHKEDATEEVTPV